LLEPVAHSHRWQCLFDEDPRVGTGPRRCCSPQEDTEDQVNRLLRSLWLLGAALITGSALVSMYAIRPYGRPKIDTLNAAATAPGQERAALP
jgi:hypothetical protein